MAVRVSQQMLFSQYVGNLNRSLNELLELNTQAQTQKKVNRPSDDPSGMVRILSHRDTLRTLEQYEENISTAEGWLGRSDETLLQVSTLITRAKELAEQASTGTYDADNREQISYEMRSIFEQLVEMANMEYEDKSIYAGQKTDGKAFQQITWMTTNDADFTDNCTFRIDGDADKTALMQFYDTSDTAAVGDDVTFFSGNVGVRYTLDGGDTWLTGTVTVDAGTGTAVIDLPNSGCSVALSDLTAASAVKANAFDTADADDSTGTWAWLRPSAQYLGDDNDGVDVVGFGVGSSTLSYTASGDFEKSEVMVRIDNASAVNMGEVIEYSYSYDGGISWTTGNTTAADTTSNAAQLSIPPGGVLTLASNGSNLLQPGQQFLIRPRTADIEIDISVAETVVLNDVGKEIFGGLYMDPSYVLAEGGQKPRLTSSNATVVFETGNQATTVLGSNAAYSKNLFETMGNLVAFLETNNQEGIQRCLQNLDESQSQILNAAASVGGREHRLEVAQVLVEGLALNEKERLSDVEDVDVAELMTDLSQQEIVYEAVLRSVSMIMDLNLMKFI